MTTICTLFAGGVSLVLLGQTVPNNSLVNFEDLVYQAPLGGFRDAPTNANGRQTLMCTTDLVACCETEGLGNWYYPDGRIVTGEGAPTYRTNRGQNEEINNQQFNGSVRIWRYFTSLERGLFRCELPDAENVVQTLYVNICKCPVIFCAYSELHVCFPQYFLFVLLMGVPSQWQPFPLVPLLLGRPTH